MLMVAIIMIIHIYPVPVLTIFNSNGSREAVYAHYQWHLKADKLFGRVGINEWSGGGLIGAEVQSRFSTVSRHAGKSA